MSSVVYLDSDELAETGPTSDDGNSWISPFSIPTSISVTHEGLRSFKLDFAYPGGETGSLIEELKADEGTLVKATLGRHTGKILTMEITRRGDAGSRGVISSVASRAC